jgi:CheY-like chemotaxis protein
MTDPKDPTQPPSKRRSPEGASDSGVAQPCTDGARRADGALLLRVDYASAEGFVEDYRHNISHGDTVIRSTRDLDRGQALRLMIGFPGLLNPLHLEGRVSWRRTDPDGNAEVAYGIELFCEGGDWSQLPSIVERIDAGDTSLIASAVLRILVVEDNVHLAELIRRGLEAHLQRTGQDAAFEIHHAENGLQALEHMRAERYDLLIVDIFLPVLDGAELIRRVRTDSHNEGLPIIAISAAEESEALAMDAGADFFIGKPIRLAQLLRTMDRLSLSVDV